ncbi:hypothetical protein C8Q76DRAFT_585754, partial [Earliella scabrosa]
MFTAFNMLQRRAVLLHSSLKVKREKFQSFADDFNSVSPEAVTRICARISQTKQVQAIDAEERRVLRLMKEVQLINTNVPGSSAARLAMRNEIRAMMVTHGMPNFYVTINPADLYNPVVKVLAGENIDIDALLPEQVPNAYEQSMLIARNPVIGARFFRTYMDAFIK